MTSLARFIAATGLTNLADGIALVAWAWVASAITRDPLLIALVPVALKAPWFVLSLPAGVLTDRVDRRRAILIADILRAAAYALAALVLWSALPLPPPPATGVDRPGLLALIAVAALLIGAAEVMRDNAAQTLMPALVDPDGLERANARLWSVEFVANNLVGTALAGLLLGAALALPFAVNAAALALAAALVAGLAGDFRPDPAPAADSAADHAAPGRSLRADLAEGLRFLLAQPVLRMLAVLTGLFNFAFEAMMVTLVLIVQERLGAGPLGLSSIFAAGGVGGIAAGLTADRLVPRLGRARILQLGMLSSLILPAAVLTAPDGTAGLILIAAAFAVSEFWGVAWNTVSVSWRQRAIPRRLLGRVNSAYRLFAIGMAPLGMLTAGLVTRALTAPLGRETSLLVPYAMGAAVMTAATAIFWRRLAAAFPPAPA